MHVLYCLINLTKCSFQSFVGFDLVLVYDCMCEGPEGRLHKLKHVCIIPHCEYDTDVLIKLP